MLKLNLSRAPTWLELGHGARILLRPADIELVGDAQSDPSFIASLGGDVLPKDEAESLAMSPAQKQRIGMTLAIALAKRAIIGWEGIGDENGNPIAEPFDEGIEALIRNPAVFQVFQRDYMAPAMNLAAEGNGFGRLPNGISEEAQTTAVHAASFAKAARDG